MYMYTYIILCLYILFVNVTKCQLNDKTFKIQLCFDSLFKDVIIGWRRIQIKKIPNPNPNRG